jgi:hypothetical protein
LSGVCPSLVGAFCARLFALGELVVKLPLAVSRLAGQQHPNKLVRGDLDEGATLNPAM